MAAHCRSRQRPHGHPRTGQTGNFIARHPSGLQQLAPEHVAANAYFTKEKVRIDWQFMLVGGICVFTQPGPEADCCPVNKSVPFSNLINT